MELAAVQGRRSGLEGRTIPVLVEVHANGASSVSGHLASYQRQNMELHAIFRSSSDGIWLCDGAGTVLNINPTSETFNGIRARDIIGRNVAALVAEGLFDGSATLDVLETRRQVSISQYVKRTEKYLLVTGTPVFDDEGTHCTSTKAKSSAWSAGTAPASPPCSGSSPGS